MDQLRWVRRPPVRNRLTKWYEYIYQDNFNVYCAGIRIFCSLNIFVYNAVFTRLEFSPNKLFSPTSLQKLFIFNQTGHIPIVYFCFRLKNSLRFDRLNGLGLWLDDPSPIASQTRVLRILLEIKRCFSFTFAETKSYLSLHDMSNVFYISFLHIDYS